jgi:hypothetical protein
MLSIYRISFYLLLTLLSQAVFADEAYLQQQIDELRSRVLQLEQELASIDNPVNWKDPVYWQKLHKGMPFADVVKVLGKPDRKENRIFETWYYHPTSRTHSYIWFDDGKVLGYEPPE